MTLQPDKLFNEKLENFTTPVPVAAWDRIEAGLNKPHHSLSILKIAASICLLSIVTFLLWPSTPQQHTDLAILNKPNSTIPVIKETPAQIQENKITDALDKTPTISNKNTTSNIKTKSDVIEAAVAQVISAENKIETELLLPDNSEAIAQQNETPIVTQTIIYSAEEVNEKFLKKELVAEATTEKKKTSGIQKLIGVAYNLASADAGLGNIRQRKDEVLALNFRDKKEGHN